MRGMPSRGGVDDVAIAWEQAVEGEADCIGASDVSGVDRLDMNVRFGAVPGVPALPEHVTDLYVLSWLYAHAAMDEMAEGYHDSAAFDEDVVAGKRYPSRLCSTLLGEGVADRGESAMRGMVRLDVVCCDHDSLHRCQHAAPEARESLRAFGAQQRAERDGRGASRVVDGHEVDRVRRREQRCAVAGHAIGRAVLDEPSTCEWVLEVKEVGHPVSFLGQTRRL